MSDIITEYEDYLHIYTDGSKQDDLAAYGVHCQYGNLSNRIADTSSIFTAETRGGHSPFGSDTHVPLPKSSLDPQLGVILTKYQTLI